jgi:hypothetical protein
MSVTTVNSDVLIRSELWDTQLKEVIKDTLQGQGFVRWISFPDGTQWTIPSVGDATVRDYVEGNAVVYDALDNGEFTFTITDYVSSATYITNKMRQDSFYASQLEASFVPKHRRAIEERLETSIFALAQAGASGGQTVSDLNNINGAPHRFVASGTNDIIAAKDFAKALYSLKKANMSDSGLIAVVDPSAEYQINTITNLVDVSNNPRWEGIVETGIGKGMRFVKNIYGFDVYVSNYLAGAGATGAGSETINANSVTNGVCNVFFSAGDAANIPFVGAWRQPLQVDGEYNKDFQREEYVTTARWGLKVYRPENLVVCISDSSQLP